MGTSALGAVITFSKRLGLDPRINLQEVRGKAKPYQVDQVIDALERLNEANQAKDNIVTQLKSGNRNGKK